MNARRHSRKRFLGGSIATAAAGAAISAPLRAAEFELKCGSDVAVDHPSSIRMTQMWAAVERATGGRVRTKYYPNSELGGTLAMISQLRLGAVDFLVMNIGNLAALVPATNIGFLGFAFKDSDQGLRIMDGPVGAYVHKECEAKGMHPLRATWNSGMYQITSGTHPIQTPDDLRGFKIRVAVTNIAVDLFKTLGASPTPVNTADTYSALQTKLIDGTSTPFASILTFRYTEVQKFISMTNHAWSGLAVIASGETWKRLPPDLRETIERYNRQFALIERHDIKILEIAVADKYRRLGLVTNNPNTEPFRQRLGPYYARWAAEFGPTEWGLFEDALGRKLA